MRIRKFVIPVLVFSALLVASVTSSVPSASGSVIALSNFSVVPSQAANGATVTGSVTVQNLDQKNAVSVVVTLFDGGAPVADNSGNPTNIQKGRTAIVQLQFKTAANPPHCYSAQATPGPVSTGYCEPGGHVLGGSRVPIDTVTLLATGLGVASIGIAGVLLTVVRRRRTN